MTDHDSSSCRGYADADSPCACRSAARAVFTARTIIGPISSCPDIFSMIRQCTSSFPRWIFSPQRSSSYELRRVARPSWLNDAHHPSLGRAFSDTHHPSLGRVFSPQRRRTSSFPRPMILGHNPSRNLNDIILHCA